MFGRHSGGLRWSLTSTPACQLAFGFNIARHGRVFKQIGLYQCECSDGIVERYQLFSKLLAISAKNVGQNLAQEIPGPRFRLRQLLDHLESKSDLFSNIKWNKNLCRARLENGLGTEWIKVKVEFGTRGDVSHSFQTSARHDHFVNDGRKRRIPLKRPCDIGHWAETEDRHIVGIRTHAIANQLVSRKWFLPLGCFKSCVAQPVFTVQKSGVHGGRVFPCCEPFPVGDSGQDPARK